LLHQLLVDRQSARAVDFVLHDTTLVNCISYPSTVNRRVKRLLGESPDRCSRGQRSWTSTGSQSRGRCTSDRQDADFMAYLRGFSVHYVMTAVIIPQPVHITSHFF